MSLKSLIDRSPLLGRALRDWRDARAIRQLRFLPAADLGFSMWGGNWLASGYHEEGEVGIVAEWLDQAELLVDIGANAGLFSLLAASMGRPAIAFEPVAANLAILLRNIEANGFEDAIEVLPIALSDTVGIAPFYGRGQGASLVAGWAGQPAFDRVSVPTNTLDRLLGARLKGRRAVIKVDVEGAELAVLRGAVGVLADRPPLLLENSLTRNHPGGHNPDFAAIFHLLWGMGYTAVVATPERPTVTTTVLADWLAAGRTDHGTENYLFLPEAM